MKRMILTMGVRGGGALGSALFLMLYAKYTSPESVGAFQYALIVALGLAILCRKGLDRSIVSCLPRYPERCYAAVLKFAFLDIIKSAAIIFPLLMAVLIAFDDVINLPASVYPVVFSYPLISISLLFSGFYKARYKPSTSFAYEVGVVSLLASALFLMGIQTGFSEESLASWSFFLSFLVLALIGTMLNIKRDSARERNITYLYQDMKKKSKSFFMMTSSVYIQQLVVAIMLSQYLGNAELGLFKVSEKVVLVIAFFQVVVNSIYSPHFSREYKSKARLAYYARKSCMASMVLSAPVFVIIMAFSEDILLFLGEGYLHAKPLILIMAIGQVFNVVTGPAGMILNMTDHERVNRNILLACSLFSVPCVVLMSKLWGGVGAAFAVMGAMALQNCLCYFYVYMKVGILVLPFNYEVKT